MTARNINIIKKIAERTQIIETGVEELVNARKVASKPTMAEKAETHRDKVLEMTIEELDLSVRSFNCLKRANINNVEDLISRTLTEVKGTGEMG